MREFRPPLRSSAVGLVLAIVFGAAMFIPAVLLGLGALGSGQVTYAVLARNVVISSGSSMDGDRTFPSALVYEKKLVDLRGARRTRGTRLEGYCTGRFLYEDLGSVWQATDCSRRAVFLRVRGEELPIVVTPPDPEGFLRDLDAGIDVHIALPKANAAILRAVLGGSALLAAFAGVMAITTFLLGPKRMRYLVGEGHLEIHTVLSRRRWPARDLRATPHAPKVSLRIAGTAFRGYYTGLFRADGQNTRIYATDVKSGVLLEGPMRVFVSPEDRDGFLAALRAEGATVGA